MKKQFDSRRLSDIANDKSVELHGIFEIEKTRANLISYLGALGYDLEEKDLTQTYQPPERELTDFVDGKKFRDDNFAYWISFQLKMSGRDVEVMENGKKVIKTKGVALLVVSLYLETDPYKKEPSAKIAKFWHNLFLKFHLEHMEADAIVEGAGEVGDFIKFFRTQVGSKV